MLWWPITFMCSDIYIHRDDHCKSHRYWEAALERLNFDNCWAYIHLLLINAAGSYAVRIIIVTVQVRIKLISISFDL